MMHLPIVQDTLHVSSSQLKAYLRCPRAFELKYVKGEPPDFVPRPLASGSAFHAALATFYKARRTGAPVELDVLMGTFRTAWAEHASGDVPLEATEGDVDDVDLAARMLTAFLAEVGEQTVTVLGVEEPFTVQLHDPETGEVLEEVLTGFIDLVVKEDGLPVVVEHKTSARRYTQAQLTEDMQLTAYQAAMEARGHLDVGLRFQVITKAASPSVQVEDVRRDERDVDLFMRTVVGVLRAMDAGAFYPLRGWQCRSCPYQRACGAR
jgi:CRISPR/Cas system-associated exonuclease Cas4 (RecB family)